MAEPASVLVIEDDDQTASLIAGALRTGPEPFSVAAACTAGAGLEYLGRERIDCVLLDYRLPDIDGLTCLTRIRSSHPELPVVILTAAGSERVAVEAMKRGASDYLVKHGRYLGSIPVAIRDALRRRYSAPAREVPVRPRDIASPLMLAGSSAVMRKALAMARRAAVTDAVVLLQGETGTGKELFARTIHESSARAAGPFVELNCAALPEPLLESELFGSVRGAFTGALRDRRGLFEEANGGTLFLDEVGEMSLALQAKLLRVLDDGRIRPLGSVRTRGANVRIVAATNRDLDQAAREGGFRRDLYYRLCVFPIRLPPLRERGEDIEILALHFLEGYAVRERKRIAGISRDALRLLTQYAWPGNVRELRNEVLRLVLAAEDGASIEPELLSPAILASDDDRPLKEIVRDMERRTIRSRLERYAYHRSATARSLGLSREALWAKVRGLGLKLPSRGSHEE